MDQHQNTFYMLGQNMFPRAPPSGYQANYTPQLQANQNQQKFDQLIRLMQLQEQQVSDYNQNMKSREDQLNMLQQQSQQLQKDLILKDKSRNEHNQIHYRNYLPTFNIQQEEPIEEQQPQPLFNSKYQQYNQGMPPEQQQDIQMSQNPRRNTPQSVQSRPQTNLKNDKLFKMQQQIEEQNEFIKQLTNLIGTKKQSLDQQQDSLTMLMNEKEDQSKLKILNEIKELKQRIEEYDQQKYRQPQQMYPMLPQQYPQNQMMPFQNQFGMYPPPPMVPPPFGYPQQQEEEESDDENINTELLMKLFQENGTKKRKRQRNNNNNNSQQSNQRKKTQKRNSQDDNSQDNNSQDG